MSLLHHNYQQHSIDSHSMAPNQEYLINVVPSIGRVQPVSDQFKNQKLHEIEILKHRNGVLHERPRDFDPSRYSSFSYAEIVEKPVDSDHFVDYMMRSRLSERRLD